MLEATFKGVARCLYDAVTHRARRRALDQGNARDEPTAEVIAVVDYGIGNLRSAQKALEHLGADARLVSDPDEVAEASGVVLPGVGAFGRCAEALRSTGLGAAVSRRLDRGVPFLGICIGFQLLFEGSEEDPSAAGLGVLGGVVRAFRRRRNVRRCSGTGWSACDGAGERSRMLAGLGDSPWVYFVHSYAPEPVGGLCRSCRSDLEYGGTVVAAVERGTLWGRSSTPRSRPAPGSALLANFVRCQRGEPCVPVRTAARPVLRRRHLGGWGGKAHERGLRGPYRAR